MAASKELSQAEILNAATESVPTLQDKGDLTHIIAMDGAQAPTMRGFAPKFQDIIDYIIKSTHEIWEERGIGRLYEYYGTNMHVHTSDGGVYTRDQVIEATIQSLAAFPDRRLYGDEVIWTGNDTDGFYTSHRLTHEGHNWGPTHYGAATGRRVNYRAIADCKVVEGRIVEEWLARDELTLIYQLGFDVNEMAKKAALDDADLDTQYSVPSEVDRLRGQLPPRELPTSDSIEFSVEELVRRSIHETWNWRLLNKVSDYYDSGYLCISASGRQFYGLNQYRTYILSLLSPFPDLAVHVDHFCYLQKDEDKYRTATRWTMMGTHTGPGVYGKPTGNQIRIMGISHHLIEAGKFMKEWTVFDEFALLKQLCRPK